MWARGSTRSLGSLSLPCRTTRRRHHSANDQSTTSRCVNPRCVSPPDKTRAGEPGNLKGDCGMKKITTAVCTAVLSCAVAHAQTADPLAPTGRWTAYALGRAATPPMGWNSWNAFAGTVDEEKV